MEAKFKNGDVVFERINPFRKLVVKYFANGLYYCHFPESAKRLFVYPERELTTPPEASREEDARMGAANRSWFSSLWRRRDTESTAVHSDLYRAKL